MSAIDILVPTAEAEGTKFSLRSWLKPVGSAVKREEAIAEIETDKVTMEVVAPADGVLESFLVQPGTAVQPGTKIGVMTGGAAATPAAAAPAPKAIAASAAAAPAKTQAGPRNTRLSPLVKRLLAQNGVDAAGIQGTGHNGRITPADVLAQSGGAPPASRAPAAVRTSEGSRKIPHTAMRRSIAEHMARSVTVAPHVTAVFEADFSAIIADRNKRKAQAKATGGAVPTFTAYFVMACVKALQEMPQVNSRWHEDSIEIFDDINIGFGVSLGNGGLVVPVIHRAQDLSLEGITQRLDQLTEKARNNQLSTADIKGGTFTISNHGVSGSLLAAPIIINQPQSAILGVGKLEKRVVVRDVNGSDAIVIAPMAYVSLSIDHRVLDGHQTNGFLTKWVEVLENWR